MAKAFEVMSTSARRGERRRQAQVTLEAKLAQAHARIRELEVSCATSAASPSDPVMAEVEGRLNLVRPMLSSLVEARQEPICGGAKAMRNFGLHAEMGCGAEQLPTIARDAKQRARGPRKSVSSDDHSPCSTFSLRFEEARRALDNATGRLQLDAEHCRHIAEMVTEAIRDMVEMIVQNQLHNGFHLAEQWSRIPAPGLWSTLNADAPAFVPADDEESRHQTRMVDGRDEES